MLSLSKRLYRFVWKLFNEASEMIRCALHDKREYQLLSIYE
jgi:hypothetical protein